MILPGSPKLEEIIMPTKEHFTIKKDKSITLRSATAVYKFLCFKLAEQKTFWGFITDAPNFRYGGSFAFSEDMQKKAEKVVSAIKEFEKALEKRNKAAGGKQNEGKRLD